MNLKLLNKQLKKFCETHLQSPSSTLRPRPPMKHPPNPQKGYSLIELLVVLAIVAILAIVGITMIQNRQSGSVREVMDELEGVLTDAQVTSQVRLGDVDIATDGTWMGTGANALFLTYNDATGKTSEAFRSHFAEAQRSHMQAGIETPGLNWYNTALGAVPGLASVAPGNAEPFVTALGNPLFTGATNKTVSVNGTNKRFTRGFYIAVVGLRGNRTYVGAPVGLIVVPNNGTGVYKFYKGPDETTWRRL